jgi:hypothetical protein
MTHAMPPAVAAKLIDISEDGAHRRYRTSALTGDALAATGALEDALRSPGLSVRAGICGDEPNEVCVEAYGRDHMGRVWPSTPIVMLDPEWDRDADMARALADDIVERWDDLRAAAQVSA